ncbi:MAG: hypothetical protein JO065_15365 [Acidobacteria bacterium]|nr:hypothetical protein [Acidobacteriota bacterium]
MSELVPGIEAEHYAALRTFLRGYLHQDVVPEHGSPVAAARAFRKDADEREASIVHAQLERLLEETSRLPDSELARVLERLGSSWNFRSRSEVEQLRDAFK